MKAITIPISEEIIEIYADIDKLKQVIIEDFVAGEYQKGNISIRQGANILGLTYEQFMVDFLGKRRISFINGTAGELESESLREEAWLDAEPKHCVSNYEASKVRRDRGESFVVIGESDWKAIEETLYLSQIPGMVASIREAAKEPLSEGTLLGSGII